MKGPAPNTNPTPGSVGTPSSEALGELAQQMSGTTSGSNQLSQSQLTQAASAQNTTTQPREVGTLGEELVKRPLADITKGIRSIFSIDHLLGVESSQKDPTNEAKKKQLHQRFNSLTQQEQAVARERYQKEMQRKQRMAEEEQMRRQQEAQKKSVQMPSSPQKGPGGKSGKQQAMQQLQDDRQKIGKVQSAN